MDTRSGWIALSAFIMIIGLAIICLLNHFILGGLLTIGGMLRMMTAFSMDSRRVRAHSADPDDPRWLEDRSGAVKRTQVAGKKCAECGRKITVASEGVTCAICDEPAHVQCNDLHRSHAHRPDGVGPFR